MTGKTAVSAEDYRRVQKLCPPLASIAGHAVTACSDLERARPDVQFYTFLREPLVRCASHFQYQVQDQKQRFSFEQWIGRDIKRNPQTTRIAGPHSTVRDAIEILKTRFRFVGLVERFDESLVMFRQLVKDPRLDIWYRRKRVAASDEIKDRLLGDPRTRALLIDANRLDLELYEFAAQELYPAFRRRYEGALDRDVVEFKGANASRGGLRARVNLFANHHLSNRMVRLKRAMSVLPLTRRMRVHILSARTPKAYNATFPLRAFRRGIRQRGMSVRFFFESHPSLLDCDVLCVVSEHWKQRADPSRQSTLERLRRYRDAVATIVWLDTSDSSGTTSFEVLPYVDLYAKSQLLRDRSRYAEPLYGMRCYTDFYHRQHAIRDTRERWRVPAPPSDLQKLAVSWNLGLGSYVQRSRQLTSRLGRLRLYSPFAAYSWTRTLPDTCGRTVDISFRGRLDYDRETLTFQRRETFRRLAEFSRETGCVAACAGRLPYRQYRDEMRRSKVVLSPFGFGEINAGRDFECFADGAALVKPDLSHLVTWPDYFEAGVTYAAHTWDFVNFASTLDRLLSDSSERLRIAREGQARYLSSLSEQGERAFVDHFQAMLQRAAGPTAAS